MVTAPKSALASRIEYPKSEIENQNARVVELADTRVLEALAARLTGSSPVPGTTRLRLAMQDYDEVSRRSGPGVGGPSLHHS